MTPSSSDGSTNSSLTQEVTHQAERKKSDAAIAETYERDNEAASLRRREPWHRRLEQRLESRSPRLYRIFQFWRGPRPKVDLPGDVHSTFQTLACEVSNNFSLNSALAVSRYRCGGQRTPYQTTH